MSANRGWLKLKVDNEIITGEKKSKPKTRNVKKIPKEFDTTASHNSYLKNNSNTADVNFFEKLEPQFVNDLAVHSKKIEEVKSWLQINVIEKKLNKNGVPILLITGPTGSGKSTTLKILCKELKINIQEWINPIDNDYEFNKGSGQLSRFTEFLVDSSFGSLLNKKYSKKIVLVEDFPNALVHNVSEFENILGQCRKNAFIFICTDVNSNQLNLAKNLFTPEIREKFNINNICFNQCPVTLLKSALKNAEILIRENMNVFNLPSAKSIEAIVASSEGDLRCALNQYYVAALQGSGNVPTETILKPQEKTSTGTKRKRTDKNLKLQFMEKDSTLGLFHGLGRVLNPKRIEHKDSWRLQANISSLVDEFVTMPSTFTDFLFENYLKYFGNLKDICNSASILSESQMFLLNQSYQHETLVFALWVSVMGLMVYNENRVIKWNQIKGPRKIKIIKENSSDMRVDIMDQFYSDLIRKNGSSHKFG